MSGTRIPTRSGCREYNAKGALLTLHRPHFSRKTISKPFRRLSNQYNL
ncbi:MAG: hypothetical protein FWH15_06030 [Betaproteobacteria bacterium]|nr:hypothetical protein [Betaproteobacteria bacterium]